MAGMGPRSCCCLDYTTRAYDLSGNTLWSANYFDGWTGVGIGPLEEPYVTTQCIDSTNVYVGGGRVTDGSNYWSLRCFDLSTGALNWQRDLQADIAAVSTGYNTGTVLEICIDNNGNAVCLVRGRRFVLSSWIDDSLQAFVIVAPSGSLVAVRTFTPSVPMGGTLYYTATSFCINQDGDYHFVDQNWINEWAYPFTSEFVKRTIVYPTGTKGAPVIIRRFGGRDYIGFSGSLPDLSFLAYPLIWAQGKAQLAAPYQLTDFDMTYAYQPDDGTGNWKNCFQTNVNSTVHDIAVDGNGNIYTAGSTYVEGYGSSPPIGGYCGITFGTVRKWNSSGAYQWATNCAGESIAIDSSNNFYTSGYENVNFQKKDSSGNYVWGHEHALTNPAALPCTREVDVNGSTSVIRTGGHGTYGISPSDGPRHFSDDINFIPSGGTCGNIAPPAACTPAVGQTNGAFTDGPGSSYTVSLFGAPPAGSWLVAVVWDNTQKVTDITISGGAPFQIAASANYTGKPGMACFIKQCDNSETGTYTISYAGAVATDNSCCALLEITGAGQLGWLSESVNTNVAPSALISVLGQLVVTCMSGDSYVSGVPSLTTLQQQQNDTTIGNGTVAIATTIPTSTGTFSPGTWTMSSTTSVTLWTLVFQC